MPKQDYSKWSRADLEKRSAELAKQRSEIREEQVEVDGLLSAHRDLDRLNLSPDQIHRLYRLSTLRADSEAAAEKQESNR